MSFLNGAGQQKIYAKERGNMAISSQGTIEYLLEEVHKVNDL